ncbi:MAG: discoidin domain-containing protein [Planctomycetota bacterium]
MRIERTTSHLVYLLLLAFCVSGLSLAGLASAQAQQIDLSGTWSFAIDPEDRGDADGWASGGPLDGELRLPGSLQSQGFGEPPSRTGPWTTNLGVSMLADERFELYTSDDDFGNPFWLTPKRLYVGVAWYEREVDIPQSWDGSRIELYLERAHWGTTVYVNGEQVGPQQTSLGTPHVHDLTAAIDAAGGPGTHTITMSIDNRLIVNVGKDAHGLGDQMNTNWNGAIGEIQLRSSPGVRIENVQLFPNIERRSVEAVVTVGNISGAPGSGLITVDIANKTGRPFTVGPIQRTIEWSADGQSTSRFTINLGESAPLWSEFDPNVLQMTARLGDHSFTTDFGLREITTRTDATGTAFVINGRRVFMRGTLDSAVFPETGYAAMDKESWARLYKIVRSYGLNHVRFHSATPPRAAFEAADELGIYLLAECSTWPNFQNAPGLPEWLEDEGDRILAEYGNHPSFVLFGVGNEFWNGGKMNDAAPMIEPAIDKWRETDTRRYYTTGAGWPQAPANDFHITQDPRLQLYPGLRLTDPPRTDLDYSGYVSQQPVPIITHEIGQWCAFPDVSAPARTRDFLEARLLGMCEDALTRAGLDGLAHSLTDASGRFQALLYKAEIEAALRTPGLAGFQLLGLADYPGHGFAPVGVLDQFLRPKGYSSPAQYQRFCADRVLLARMPARVFEQGDRVAVQLDLAHYGRDDIEGTLDWSATGSQSGRIAGGSFAIDVDAGGLADLLTVDFDLPSSESGEEVRIEASIRGSTIANDWSIWSYPASAGGDTDESDLRIVRSIDAEVARDLDAGETVLVFAPPAWIAADTFGSFRPIFWNTVLFTTQREHTLGALIDRDHPALAAFPTQEHVSWQWWDILFKSKPIPLGGLSSPIDPIVRPIDDWVDPRSLGLLFEARVGQGKVLICGVDLETDLAGRPAARALRASLTDYARSDAFAPRQRLEGWELTRLFREPSEMQKLNAAVTASNAHPGYGPELVLDGDPATFWHTAWAPTQVEPPHSLEIDLGLPRPVAGLRYTPRSDSENGRFAEYRIEVSDAGYDWTQVKEGAWQNDATVKSATWQATQARYVRLTMLRSTNGEPYASAAEVEIIVE